MKISLALSLLTLYQFANQRCPKNWTELEDKCVWVSKDKMTFEKAKTECQTRNSVLFEVQSTEQIKQVFDLTSIHLFFIGTFGIIGNCLIVQNGDKEWIHDQDCSSEHHYVCQRPFLAQPSSKPSQQPNLKPDTSPKSTKTPSLKTGIIIMIVIIVLLFSVFIICPNVNGLSISKNVEVVEEEGTVPNTSFCLNKFVKETAV